MAEPVRRRDRSFAPTVLLGLAAGALAAVAATRDWAQASGDAAGVAVHATASGSTTAPLAAALALVALAAWGVVLVLRCATRRIVAVVGALASAGVLATVLAAFNRAQSQAVDAAVDRGATGDAFTSSLTGWYVTCGVAALLALACFAVAVVRAPGWPAMGSKYDAPAARHDRPATEEDMWRALDRGHDPTS